VRRNEKAYFNGLKGEQYALTLYDQIELLDRLIDARIGDRLTEIKTCQEWQSNGKRRCRGRFVLDEEQHKYLVENGGYYLFIVLMDDGSVSYRFVRASEIQFKRKISWLNIFSGEITGEAPERAGGNAVMAASPGR
jgi:hypothetical protein